MLGFSLFQGSAGEDTGLLARNSRSHENKFLALQPRAAEPSLVFSDHGDQDTRGGHFSIFGTIRPGGELIPDFKAPKIPAILTWYFQF